MSSLYEELKYVSQFIEIVEDWQKEKMRSFLFDKHRRWDNFSIFEKIQFYMSIKLPEKFIAKIYVAFLLVSNSIVTQDRHNTEVPDETIEWFKKN